MKESPPARTQQALVACSLMTDLSAAIWPGKPAQSFEKLARSQCSAQKNDERACLVEGGRLQPGLRHHFSSHAANLLSSWPTDRPANCYTCKTVQSHLRLIEHVLQAGTSHGPVVGACTSCACGNEMRECCSLHHGKYGRGMLSCCQSSVRQRCFDDQAHTFPR